MSQYLRDEFLKNLSLSDEALRKINDDMLDIAKSVNENLRKQYQNQELLDRLLMPSYIIRFDQKGFRLYEFEKVMRYFQDADQVERFIFILDSIKSLNRLTGKSLELRFDSKDPNNCYLVVQDDDINWVDSVFCKLKERLNKYRNKNIIIQNRWIPFIVQLLGVITGFIISLWLAIKISPKLAIENSLAFTFIIAFLLFSNIWTLLYDGALRCLNYFWPNISFKKRGGLHWLIKATISSAFVGFSFFIINRLFLYVTQIIKAILKP